MLHLAVKQDSITLFSILVKYSGKSFQTLRYYGYYSNKCRGMRKKALDDCMKNISEACKEGFKGAYHKYVTVEHDAAHLACGFNDKDSNRTNEDPPSSQKVNYYRSRNKTSNLCRVRASRWRERIIAIWGYDPLQCPCCQGPMKVVATVQTLESIRVILIPLGLWEPPELRSVRAPRAPPSSVRSLGWCMSSRNVACKEIMRARISIRNRKDLPKHTAFVDSKLCG